MTMKRIWTSDENAFDVAPHNVGGEKTVQWAMNQVLNCGTFNENGVTGLIPLSGPPSVWHAIQTEKFAADEPHVGMTFCVRQADEALRAQHMDNKLG